MMGLDDGRCDHQHEIDGLNNQLSQLRNERGTLLTMLADIVMEGRRSGVDQPFSWENTRAEYDARPHERGIMGAAVRVRDVMRRQVQAIEAYFLSINVDPQQISSEARLRREAEAKREEAQRLMDQAERLMREADGIKR